MTTIKPQQRRNVFVLDLPWGMKYPGVKYDAVRKINYFEGAVLPSILKPYRSEDFSYLRWMEDDINGAVMPPEKSRTIFKPRPHQIEAAKVIYRSFTQGWPGFLEADKTGLGKTLSTLTGVASIASKNGLGPETRRAKVLVVCPKGVIPVWRQTLRNYPMGGQQMRVLVINYHQLLKLIDPPKEAKEAKKKRTKDRHTVMKGTPKVNWDFVIFDEEHYLKNYPSSTMSLAAANIAKLNEPYIKGKSPFVISSTATPGATPLNMAIMSPWLARLINPKSAIAKKVTPLTWGSFLEKEKFAVTKGSNGWAWATVPFYNKNSKDKAKALEYEEKIKEAKHKQRHDSRRIGKALTSKNAPFIMRSPKDIAGWPEQQVIPFPIPLEGNDKYVYEDAWTRFRDFLRLPKAKRDPKSQLVESLRYRQKSSLLKVDSTVEQIQDWIAADMQVFVSVEFIETLEKFAEGLRKAKIPFVEVSGRNSNVREDMRIKFQKGQAKVVLCTVVEGVSFHSNEILPDGTKASPAERVTVIADIRQNNLNTTQSLGRAHRDGENSIAYIPFLQDTIDERVIQSFTNKNANMLSMTGASDAEANHLDNLFEKEAAKSR